MDEHSKVISLRQFRTKRKVQSLKSKFAFPIALIIGAGILVIFVGSISYPVEKKDLSPNGFITAKTGITQLK